MFNRIHCIELLFTETLLVEIAAKSVVDKLFNV